MGKCDADSGVLFSACLPVSQSLRSNARCCDAGSRVVSPACPCVSQSLRSDARCCDDGLSPCVCQSLRSDARCRGAGSGVVSPACLPVSQSLRSDARCCDASPACLPVSPKVSAVRCQPCALINQAVPLLTQTCQERSPLGNLAAFAHFFGPKESGDEAGTSDKLGGMEFACFSGQKANPENSERLEPDFDRKRANLEAQAPRLTSDTKKRTFRSWPF